MTRIQPSRTDLLMRIYIWNWQGRSYMQWNLCRQQERLRQQQVKEEAEAKAASIEFTPEVESTPGGIVEIRGVGHSDGEDDDEVCSPF